MVRWGAAQAMNILAGNLESPQVIQTFLLPLLKDLLGDKNDSVKVHAVGAAISVVKLVQDTSKI